MYHTFQASTGPAATAGDGTPGKPKDANSRRISTSNACLECRRRKIRCDGNMPCSQCQWYHHPEACKYTKPTQRVVPSRALVERLTTKNAQNETIFNRMFPGRDVDTLISLSREELLNLALTLPASSPAGSARSATHQSGPDSVAAISEAAHSLEALEQAPDEDGLNDEVQRHLDTKVQRVSDDVNGLSLTVDKQSSYVGVSSVTAALKVIFKVSPGARIYLAHGRPIETALPSRANTPPPFDGEPDALAMPTHEEGKKALEAYFTRIHPLMPMVDEVKVWHFWQQDHRRDAPWLALINTILALGTLALGNSVTDRHTVFFKRAMHHINIELLGSSNVMAVQAIGLMSGYYLHYVNRPNLASSLMGAGLRMATVLGMHRDFAQPQPDAGQNVAERTVDSADANPTEIRRRTWWSLVNLDAWANVTQGRPTLGRLGPGVTARAPRVAQEKMDQTRYQEALKMLPIIHLAPFGKILTRIQDLLAVNHTLEFDEMLSLDSELVSWHDDLPTVLIPQHIRSAAHEPRRRASSAASKKPILKSPIQGGGPGPDSPFDFSQPLERIRSADSCPVFLRTARQVMHFRYQNVRMILHRPAVLAAALRQMPFANLSAEEKVAVGRCRAVAAQSIADIDGMCEEEPIAAWNGVWFMYQAVMVPLVSLFAQLSMNASKMRRAQIKSENSDDGNNQPSPASTGGDTEVDKWKQQIETAVAFFGRMEHWSITAKKSRDVVTRLYEAATQFGMHNTIQRQQLYATAQATPVTASVSQDSLQAPRDFHGVLPAAQHQQQNPGLSFTVPPPQQDNFVPPMAHPGGMPTFQHRDTQGFVAPMANHPAFHENFWTLPTPRQDMQIDQIWQEMAWDTVPMFEDESGYGMMEYYTDGMGAMGIPGSVAVDMVMEGGYFPGMPHDLGGGMGHPAQQQQQPQSRQPPRLDTKHLNGHMQGRQQPQQPQPNGAHDQANQQGVQSWDYGYAGLPGGSAGG